jgi:hypothetical protein
VVEVQLKSTASYDRGNHALLYCQLLSPHPVTADSMVLRRQCFRVQRQKARGSPRGAGLCSGEFLWPGWERHRPPVPTGCGASCGGQKVK